MATTTALPRTRRFTANEVLRMVESGIVGEDEPLELLNGELVQMSPQGPGHSARCTYVRDRLLGVYGKGFVVREAKPVVAGRHSLPEPDVGIHRGSYRDFAERHPTGEETLLAVEVAVTSLAIDRAKAEIYSRAGVPVYWILDLEARRLEVRTGPRPDGTYEVTRVLSGDDTVELPRRRARWRVSELFL